MIRVDQLAREGLPILELWHIARTRMEESNPFCKWEIPQGSALTLSYYKKVSVVMLNFRVVASMT